MPHIRLATGSDAKKLTSLAQVTFRETFIAKNKLENIDAYCRENHSEAIQSAELSNPNIITIVAQSDDDLVAFAQIRLAQSGSGVVATSPGELQRIYVAKTWQGKGLAQQLMSACLEQLKNHQSDVVWLSVWEQNPRAIAFYKKLNFEAVGKQLFTLGSEQQQDIIMAKSLCF